MSVKFNVGGVFMETSLYTIQKYPSSKLAQMIGGDGKVIFMDRNPLAFLVVLVNQTNAGLFENWQHLFAIKCIQGSGHVHAPRL